MVNEFKLIVVHFTRPNPMQICATAGQKYYGKSGLALRTSRPPGHRATGLLLAKPRGIVAGR